MSTNKTKTFKTRKPVKKSQNNQDTKPHKGGLKFENLLGNRQYTHEQNLDIVYY